MESINIAISKLENADSLKEVLKEKQWSMELGLEVLLAYGLAYINAKNRLKSCMDKETELDGIIKEHINNEAAYASMRFRNFQLSKDNKLLNFKLLGFHFDNEQLKATIDSLFEDNING